MSHRKQSLQKGIRETDPDKGLHQSRKLYLTESIMKKLVRPKFYGYVYSLYILSREAKRGLETQKPLTE
ncbi:hypothetical protein VNO80_12142 [Phaseolus coccineus]|uniref:Uncharacterized protein n=1 Tax=Phaseolus coccineus TaxID=3886 RepID=A0AAN9NHR8_PHACN